ncbi:MAG TPA: protein YgfX [Quisquiliibacterium sp.]|nr:protein YgfX [Quisquiliibacterium sp.]
MSLAFALRPGPSRRVCFLVALTHACAALGVLGASLQLAAAGALASSGLWLLGLIPVGWSWGRAWGARMPCGRLVVDGEGAARWSGGAGCPSASARDVRSTAARAEHPGGEIFEPRRWLVFAGVVWIDARVGDRRLSLLSGEDAVSDPEWRGLMRWLRWLDRRH